MKGMKGTILGLGALAAAAISAVLHHGKTTVTYEQLTGAITNPLTGFAAMADYPSLAETASMVFVKITWAELEPEEGVFDWAGIEERLHLSEWGQKENMPYSVSSAMTRGMRRIWTFPPGWQKRQDGMASNMIFLMERAMRRITTIPYF